MTLSADRRIAYDWYDGVVPECVDIAEQSYVESAFSFIDCRSRRPHALRIARGAHVYSSTIFDLGPEADVAIGECSMLNGARLICEGAIEIGRFATISWNVVFMDSYRLPLDPDARRPYIMRAARAGHWPLSAGQPSRPIRLHDNVWIGFDVCVLPGVTIGEGSVVGARSVVASDVAPYMVVAGNPARPIRELPRPSVEVNP
jgi:acetyltransferase-like isoleucine patch superfamily enzyme